MKNKVNVGIIGVGTVGSGVVDILRKNKSIGGISLNIARIAEVNRKRWKDIRMGKDVFTVDPMEVVCDPEIDIVVELIGGTKIARDIVQNALKNGKAVVTANKALLAEHGDKIFDTAKKYGTDIYYEASVAGGIPIIKALREGLSANKIDLILGIVNGTCNYILSSMRENGSDFKDALAKAQKAGYAERNPKLDISGIDSAHKLVILSSLAMGRWIDIKNVYTEGIERITHQDILYADEFGYVIKLLAICKEYKGKIETRVHPAFLPKTHQLSWIGGVYNAVFVRGNNCGSQLFSGKGAGKLPTASAVVADIADVARNLCFNAKQRVPAIIYRRPELRLRPMNEIMNKCYIRISALDRPGVLAKISGILGKNNISISSVIQKGRHRRGAVPIVMMTHRAVEKNIQKALNQIGSLPEVKDKPVMIRVEK